MKEKRDNKRQGNILDSLISSISLEELKEIAELAEKDSSECRCKMKDSNTFLPDFSIEEYKKILNTSVKQSFIDIPTLDRKGNVIK